MGLLDKIKSTNKVGRTDVLSSFYLQFPEVDGAPTFELEDSLTIGREAGEVLLTSEDISPRHCTFYLNQDVISIMDHNSHEGTFIGKKQIDPGRMIILLPGDKLSLGNVKVNIINQQKHAPLEQHEFKSMEIEDIEEVEDVEESEEDEIENDDKVDKKNKNLKPITKIGTNIFKVKMSRSSGQVSNGLLRTFALIFDFLIVLTILSIISPFQDLISLVDEIIPTIINLVSLVPEAVKDLAAIDILEKLKAVTKSVPELEAIWNDLTAFYHNPSSKNIWQVIGLFVVLRITGTLILGVSFGQFLAGIRADGNIVVNRILGVIRECIGFFTGPFLIFDSLTLVNKPSLKEFITFTRIVTPSALRAWISSILSLVLLLGLYIFSPLFKGFEPLTSHQFTDALKLNPDGSANEVRPYFSKKFGMSFNEEIKNNLIPSYSIVKTSNQKVAHIEISVLTENDQIKIRPYRDFVWSDLLKTALNLNPLAHDKFANLYSVLHSAGNENANFKSGITNHTEYFKELVALTNTAFNLGVSNAVTYIQEFGPFIRTFADYRQQFMDLMPPDTKLLMVTNSKDAPIFVNSSLNGKFYIIPISYPHGKVFEVTAKEMQPAQLQNLLKKLYFLNPEKPKSLQANPEFNLMAFIDNIYDGLGGKEKVQNLQYSYEWLYLRLKMELENSNERQIKAWSVSIKKLIELLEIQKLHQNMDKPAWNKFYQHLNDLLKALEDRDLKYFDIASGKLV